MAKQQYLGFDPDGAEWEVWFDYSAAELNAAVPTQRSDGWYPVSVDVYGVVGLYVVVWKKPKAELLQQLAQTFQGQPRWNATFGVTEAGLMAFDATERALLPPRYPNIVTATKDPFASPPLFSAVHTQMAGGYSSLLFFAPINQLEQDITWFRQTQRTLRCAAVYGRRTDYGAFYLGAWGSADKYVGVYVKNQRPYEVYWNCTRVPGFMLDRHAHAFWRSGVRPSFVLLQDHHTNGFLGSELMCIWYNDSIGPHALRVVPRSETQTEMGIEGLLKASANEGYFPYRLSSAIMTGQQYFAVILARTGQRLQRVHSIRRLSGLKVVTSSSLQATSAPPSLGAVAQALSGGANPPPGFASGSVPIFNPTPADTALAALDKFITDRMYEFNIRAGSLAVTYEGRLVLANAYTFAEPGYPITLPTTAFRLGSIGKPITSIAIHQLLDEVDFDAGFNLKLDTNLQERFPVTKRDGDPPSNEHWGTIQLKHLLRHRVPWVNCPSGAADPLPTGAKPPDCYGGEGDLHVAKWWDIPKPLEKLDIIQWAAKTSDVLTGPSGIPPFGYSNFNYLILGQIIEQTTGRLYDRWIKEEIWKMIGFTENQIDDQRRVDVMVLGNPQHGLPHGTLMPHHVRPEDGIPHVEPAWFSDGRYEAAGRNDGPFTRAPEGGWSAAPLDLLRLYATFDNPDHAQQRLRISKQGQSALWAGQRGIPFKDVMGWYGHNGSVPGGISDSARNPFSKVSIAYAFNIDPPETWWEWKGYQWKDAFLSLPSLITLVEAVRATGVWDNLDLWWFAGITEPIPAP